MANGETVTIRMKPYIQPFERQLAVQELQGLSGVAPEMVPDDENEFTLRVQLHSAEELANRLAYWESVTGKVTIWTKQLRREATTYAVRNGINPAELQDLLPFKPEDFPIPNRRCLRYGPHDIHDYRGKFFPQLVRALLNLCALGSNPVVLDPMCGSGTTLVEANLASTNAMGMDVNPLSVLITRTKCGILRVPPESLIRDYERVRKILLKPRQRAQASLMTYVKTLPAGDQKYLGSWFAPHVLCDLDMIASVISSVKLDVTRDLFWLCLSDILRRVSWQKTDDLRVRREDKNDADIDAVAEYLSQLGRTVRHVVAFLLEEGQADFGSFEVIRADARTLTEHLVSDKNKVDAVITSPPYATALPYLDTDRLSLCFLKLLPREEHRATDYSMIGNREITENQRLVLMGQYYEKKASLPIEVQALVDRVDRVYGDGSVGFRRRNLGALLSKYFLDMRQVFRGIAEVVKPGGEIFVVVGNNHTVAHGERIEIETADLLARLGASVGLVVKDALPMDMLTPRDIFKKNSVASEYIVHLRRAAS